VVKLLEEVEIKYKITYRRRSFSNSIAMENKPGWRAISYILGLYLNKKCDIFYVQMELTKLMYGVVL